MNTASMELAMIECGVHPQSAQWLARGVNLTRFSLDHGFRDIATEIFAAMAVYLMQRYTQDIPRALSGVTERRRGDVATLSPHPPPT